MSDSIFDQPKTVDEANSEVSRRKVLARAGIAGAFALGAGVLGLGKPSVADAALSARYGGAKGNKFPVSDVDILNFALQLEYLEGEFYLRASAGYGLGKIPTGEDLISGTGTQGTVTGNALNVKFDDQIVAQIAGEIALDELNHVRLLRSVLGKKAVAEPTINLVDSFTTALTAAGIAAAAGTLTPTEVFLVQAFTFEDVGVTAYHGAAPYINNSAYLNAAAGVLAVEAYHAGVIRNILLQRGQSNPTLIVAANAISDLRAAATTAANASNTQGSDQGITLFGNANLVPTDGNSVAFSRTFAEVLSVVYLGGASGKFGFFPNKLNGKIS